MGKRKTSSKKSAAVKPADAAGRPSALIDTRVIYCDDNLEQLAKLPDGCIELIFIDPPESSNRNYEVFWGDKSEPRPLGSGFHAHVEDRHASTQTYIDYLRPQCIALTCVLKNAGGSYNQIDWFRRYGNWRRTVQTPIRKLA